MAGRTEVHKPRTPRPGSAVGLVTPSSSIHPFPRRTARASRALARLGFVPILSPHAEWPDDRKPDPEALAADIAWRCEHPEIDAILCTTGGSTSTQILPHLDYDLLRRSRKVLCGFSDITAILLAVFARTGMVTFHGPTLLPSFGDADGTDPRTAAALLDTWAPGAPRLLTAPETTSTDSPWWDREDDRPRVRVAATAWRRLTPGVAQGRLVGGHLGTMVGLADSPYLPATDSCLVFIETNDSRVDRITDELTRLARAGVFDRAAGLVFGRPVGVDRPADLYRALTRLALEYSLPALADVDIGHTVPILTLPIGVTATIDTDSRMLRLDEAAVVSDG